MQTIATKVFIIASICFSFFGLLLVFTTPMDSEPNPFIFKALFTCVFIILPSFALSVAGKYLQK